MPYLSDSTARTSAGTWKATTTTPATVGCHPDGLRRTRQQRHTIVLGMMLLTFMGYILISFSHHTTTERSLMEPLLLHSDRRDSSNNDDDSGRRRRRLRGSSDDAGSRIIIIPGGLPSKFLAPVVGQWRITPSIPHYLGDGSIMHSDSITTFKHAGGSSITSGLYWWWILAAGTATSYLIIMLSQRRGLRSGGAIIKRRSAALTDNTPSSGCELPQKVYASRHAVDTMQIAPGLDLGTIRKISKVNNEPDWLLDFREKAYKWWKSQNDNNNLPDWGEVGKRMPSDMRDMLQNLSMFSRPENLTAARPGVEDILNIKLNDDEELREVKNAEDGGGGGGAAVDAVFDSLSIATTRRKELYDKYGIIFCSLLEAARDYPDLVRKYLGSVVPVNDNYYAALNSCVFSDGTFIYVPPNVHCPVELSTYFRINNTQSGQFERTLIIADKNSSVSYIEGCTAAEPPPPPIIDGANKTREPYQMHAAVVELIALDDAKIKYSTAQNWHSGSQVDGEWSGGVLNLVTKRGQCRGRNSIITWTQVESGSAVTWKYPSCVLLGEGSVGEFYSVTLTSNTQEADTGTKMMHIGDNTKSTSSTLPVLQSSGVESAAAAEEGEEVRAKHDHDNADAAVPHHVNTGGGVDGQIIEHEASTSRVSADQLQYLMSRGLQESDVLSLLLVGFCEDVFTELPLEFAEEASAMLKERLRGSVGAAAAAAAAPPEVPIKVESSEHHHHHHTTTDHYGHAIAIGGDGIKNLYVYDVSTRDKVKDSVMLNFPNYTQEHVDALFGQPEKYVARCLEEEGYIRAAIAFRVLPSHIESVEVAALVAFQRNRGYGSKLLKSCCNDWARKGLMHALTYADGGTAVDFFTTMGFTSPVPGRALFERHLHKYLYASMMVYNLYEMDTFSLRDTAMSLINNVNIGDRVLCIADATQSYRHAVVRDIDKTIGCIKVHLLYWKGSTDQWLSTASKRLKLFSKDETIPTPPKSIKDNSITSKAAMRILGDNGNRATTTTMHYVDSDIEKHQKRESYEYIYCAYEYDNLKWHQDFSIHAVRRPGQEQHTLKEELIKLFSSTLTQQRDNRRKRTAAAADCDGSSRSSSKERRGVVMEVIDYVMISPSIMMLAAGIAIRVNISGIIILYLVVSRTSSNYVVVVVVAVPMQQQQQQLVM
ncbi:hypothetical protein FOZ63_004418 [Perkinsus olseni]|uniref:N-acetyltransferase domain-containing protein n=1 Tax=Perkinsus olseni TaxID=32597 RepID=A0A7J6RU39_PEROL|nr:hypothetical protein FOZ63_004418 [Perkinsus olseni]